MDMFTFSQKDSGLGSLQFFKIGVKLYAYLRMPPHISSQQFLSIVAYTSLLDITLHILRHKRRMIALRTDRQTIRAR